MDKNKWSRRNFLQMLSGLSVVPLMGKLQKYIPEIDGAYAKSDAKVRAILQIPDDLVMQAVEPDKAANMIAQALAANDALSLQKSLTTYQPVIKEAHVTTMTWAKGTQNATVVSIPFVDQQKHIAVLQCVTRNGASEYAMAEFSDQKDWTKARVHTLKDGKIATADASPASTIGGATLNSKAAGGACTAQLLIQCLGLWGCSGLALATCAAALLLCPFTIVSCIAVYTCTLYCGGAWSYCFCWACGC